MDAPVQPSDAQQAFIYYWKDYWQDKRNGMLPLCKLHQNSPVMQRIRPGDIVWAFTRRVDGVYVIVAQYLGARVGDDPENDNTRAGRTFFESEPSGLASFEPDKQDSAEEVIRSLSPRITADPVGGAFQGPNAVKSISAEDCENLRHHVAARAAANMWGTIERDARKAEGSEINPAISRKINQDLSASTMEGLTAQQKTWVRERAAWLADKFWKERWRGGGGVCDDCQFDPVAHTKDSDVKPRSLMDVHHKHPLEEGIRLTTLDDFALLCPNCHRYEHARMRLSSVRRPA
jgi:hypothetical protein